MKTSMLLFLFAVAGCAVRSDERETMESPAEPAHSSQRSSEVPALPSEKEPEGSQSLERQLCAVSIDSIDAEEALVSLDVREGDLVQVLRDLSRQVGVTIVVDPEIREQVTVRFCDKPWREALELLAKQTCCKVHDNTPRWIRLWRPPLGNVEFQDADLRVALDFLARPRGIQLIVSDDVSGNVSGVVQCPPTVKTISTFLEDNGLALIRSEEDAPDVYRVVRP